MSIPGAQWLQLEFSAFDLGEGGSLAISAGDEVQTFDQETLETWQGLTAMFNGSEVTVTLTPGAGETATATLRQFQLLDLGGGGGGGCPEQPR